MEPESCYDFDDLEDEDLGLRNTGKGGSSSSSSSSAAKASKRDDDVDMDEEQVDEYAAVPIAESSAIVINRADIIWTKADTASGDEEREYSSMMKAIQLIRQEAQNRMSGVLSGYRKNIKNIKEFLNGK